MLDGTSILVTGGTGSFGRTFIRTVLECYPGVRRLVVFSRDELKQSEMAQEFPRDRYPQLRFFIGDVRDAQRLTRALEGVEVVIHAAALKQIPAAEYNPFECIKTNILGAQNLIEACFEQGVRRVIALSTDKAAAPVNLYGATKLCSDKLFVAANNARGPRDLRFSVVRYGNVFGSRGSVIPLFQRQKRNGTLTVTDKRMTRFNITLQEGVELVLQSLEIMGGGEIFIPKIPSYRILDVAEAIAPGCRIEEVGIRPGEKLHEVMITEHDSLNTWEFDDYYMMLPSMDFLDLKAFSDQLKLGRPCPDGFRYCSATNDRWLSVEQIRTLVKEYPSYAA